MISQEIESHSPLVQNSLGAVLPYLQRAEGVWLYDTTGKDYLDGCSGAVVANIGHSHPRVLARIQEQAARVTYAHRGAFVTQQQIDLAQRLTQMTGFTGAWFVNSGSEAVEATLQLAMQYHRERGEPRSHFLSHRTSYHGNTLGALSHSDHARRSVIQGIEVSHDWLPSPYDPNQTADQLLHAAQQVIESSREPIAGILFEPVSGASLSARPLVDGYLAGLRELCNHHGILLIADEVMTGLGRTGKNLACDHWSVKPDLVALGKGLGAGYTPIAAALLNETILDVLTLGSGRILGGHTYGGNPLSVAVADEVLQVTLEQDLVAASANKGKLLHQHLKRLQSAFPTLVEEVHGKGLLQGVTLHAVADGEGTGSTVEQLRLACLEEGLIIYPATGGFNDSFLVAPPLTSTHEEIEELIRRLERAMSTLRDNLLAQK